MAEVYRCRRCDAQFGIAGVSTGSPDDDAADEHFDAEVDWHESGSCTPMPTATGERREIHLVPGEVRLVMAADADGPLLILSDCTVNAVDLRPRHLPALIAQLQAAHDAYEDAL